MSHSLQPHRLQHARLLCPLSPGVSSNLCPLNRWCYITVPSSATPFSFCLRFPSELAFYIRWPKYWSFSFSHQSFQWIFIVDSSLASFFKMVFIYLLSASGLSGGTWDLCCSVRAAGHLGSVVWHMGMWDFSSLTRDQTCVSCIGRLDS